MGRLRWLACAAVVTVAAPIAAAEPANGLTVVTTPQPDFPAEALAKDMVGYCEVKFSMTDYVRMNLGTISCSAPEFCTPTHRAITRAEFMVEDAPGTSSPGKRDNIVYPIVYAINDAERAADAKSLSVSPCGSVGY